MTNSQIATTVVVKRTTYEELKRIRFTMMAKKNDEVSFDEVVKILVEHYNGSGEVD